MDIADCIKQHKVAGNMKKNGFVCFAGNDWWYHNRNHFDAQMVRYLAKHGSALYINSIVMQKVNISQSTKFAKKLIRKVKSICRGLKKTDDGFWVYSPFSLPVHHIAWLRQLNRMIVQLQVWFVCRILHIRNPVVLVACPAACDMAINMKKSRLVYQRTDRFEDFPNADTKIIKDYDRKLKAAADLTVFVNRMLYEEESDKCRKAICLDHGVDYEKFAFVKTDRNIPADIANIPKPIVGYFGQLDNYTIDIDFLEKVVDCLPEMSFVFIGETAANCPELMKDLTVKKNVSMLGKKPYEQVPHYGKCFDVAIMPWLQNRWIQACNPIKLKEYLALGKPVVSTPYNELSKYLDVVYEAKTPEEFAHCIEKALTEDNPERIAARRKKVQAHTWDGKGKRLLQTLFGKAGNVHESD